MISICNVTRNRKDNLETCWRTWLFADEIIILDYGSDIPIKIQHPKVKVLRYESETFCKTKGLNMAIGFAKGDIIIQADSDYYFNKQFEETDILPGEFMTGFELTDKDEKEILSLTGFCMYWKKDWEEINGYNERINKWGYEDDDFYLRLEKSGLKHKKIKPRDITHLPHDNKVRLQEYKVEGISNQVLARCRAKNKIIANEMPWTLKDKRSKYENI